MQNPSKMSVLKFVYHEKQHANFITTEPKPVVIQFGTNGNKVNGKTNLHVDQVDHNWYVSVIDCAK